MWTYNNSELYHHGILGMKWGHHKKYSSGEVKALQKVSNAKKVYKDATTEYNKKTLGGMIYDKKASQDLNIADRNLRYAKEDLSDEKVKSKISNQTKKSGRQLTLEKHYQEKGMTKDEAEIAAYKRAKTEKILAITAGLTVAAVAVYAANKYRDENVDKIIKSGKTLQNISGDKEKGVADAFYASFNKMDRIKYQGIYGSTFDTDVINTKVKVTNDLKVASEKSAIKTMKDLFEKDSSFKDNAISVLENMGPQVTAKQNKTVERAILAIKSGKIDKSAYEGINLALTNHSEAGQKVSSALYDKLRSKGYDAIKDINDSKLSGYGTKNPIIVFNGAAKTAVESRSVVDREVINKSRALGMAEIMSKALVENGSQFAAIYAGVAVTGKAINAHTQDKIVKQYKKDNPETKLSYKEIVRNYQSAHS